MSLKENSKIILGLSFMTSVQVPLHGEL